MRESFQLAEAFLIMLVFADRGHPAAAFASSGTSAAWDPGGGMSVAAIFSESSIR